MKVHQIQQKTQNQKQPTNFKGAGDAFLRYLATNQAVGANGVDVAFMVVPRTTTDMIGRGPAAGLETARREASGTANHTLVGVYGIGAGLIASALMGIDKKFGTRVNKIFTAPETLNILAENKAQQIKGNRSQIEYLKETLQNIKAFNPTSKQADAEGYVKLTNKTIDEIATLFNQNLEKKVEFDVWKNKKTSNSFQVAMNKIIETTGAESEYVLTSSDKKIISNTKLDSFLEDLYKVSDAFNKEEVKKAFKEQVENNKSIAENKFVQKLGRFMKSRSIAGFALATAIGMSIQPLNIYLTKKKTGSDGFVGVEGRTKDNSTGFKILKGLSAVGFGAMVLGTLKTGLKGFMDKMTFKGFWPTISQLKGIYGLTIISRLLATRDKDELREALTKDTLGFLSWLVLGDIVNKITAEGLDKSVMNRTKEVSGQNFLKRVFNSKLKTRDEVLIEALAENGISTVKKNGEEIIAKTFKEMMQDIDSLPEAVKKVTKKRLGTLNKAQLAGYAFSGLVLGLGIPNLNIYITNKLDKKRKAQQAEQAQLTKA